MKSSCSAIVAAGLLIGASTSLQASVTIPNPSFEKPATSGLFGFIYRPTVSGVTFTGDSGIAPDGSLFGFTKAPDGTQVGFLQGFNGANATISFDLLGLNVGSFYTLSFFAAQRPNYLVNPLQITFNGTSIGTFAPLSTTFQSFTTSSFASTGTNGTLAFIGAGGPPSESLEVGIDGLSINEVNAAVPEPATWAMMIGGFGIVGGAMRYRRRRIEVTYATV